MKEDGWFPTDDSLAPGGTVLLAQAGRDKDIAAFSRDRCHPSASRVHEERL